MPPEITHYREQQVALYKEVTRRITIERPGIRVTRVSELLPLFFAQATPESVGYLNNEPLVAAVFFHDRSFRIDLSTSLRKSGAAEAGAENLSALGAGVKVAVWEQRPDDETHLTIEDHFQTGASPTDDHARLVSAIIKNKEPGKPKGYAPKCKLYSANVDYTLTQNDYLEPLEWAIKQGCTVINQSYHSDTDEENAGLQLSDLITDAIALVYPYPTVVQAAGNTGNVAAPKVEYVNHKGFNSLKVGSHDEGEPRRIVASSAFVNPSSAHGDRELPEICALGKNISAVGLVDRSGTSFASPAVAGSVALIQGENFWLPFYPEACRAILLASSKRNVDAGMWYEDLKKIPRLDQRDGTGALNVYEAIQITKNAYPDLPPGGFGGQWRGWSKGKFDNRSFGANGLANLEFKIKVPVKKKNVKIVLAWNSSADYAKFMGARIGYSDLELDLDLLVYDEKNNLVATSSSFDNSYEIVEYKAQGGQTLTVKINRWSGPKTAWTYFGIAWTCF